MTRIPLLKDEDIAPGPVLDAVRARRQGRLLALDRLLLHSAPVAEGWNHMMGRVRGELALDPMLRELAICAVAVLNGADYELFHHAPLFLAHGGTQAQLEALGAYGAAAQDSPLFDATQRAVLRMTAQSTREVRIGDATFAEVRRVLGSDRLVFELLVVIAAYNMVSRVLVGAGLAED